MSRWFSILRTVSAFIKIRNCLPSRTDLPTFPFFYRHTNDWNKRKWSGIMAIILLWNVSGLSGVEWSGRTAVITGPSMIKWQSTIPPRTITEKYAISTATNNCTPEASFGTHLPICLYEKTAWRFFVVQWWLHPLSKTMDSCISDTPVVRFRTLKVNDNSLDAQEETA